TVEKKQNKPQKQVKKQVDVAPSASY
ncbi:MAG: hypothetical protein ACJAZM_000383, partial [Cyclobacteriaceae bacterium]